MRRLGLSASMMIVLFAIGQSRAADINYATGFENGQGFTLNAPIPNPPGSLNGWIRFDESPAAGTLPTINVGSIASSGAQGLTFQTLGASGDIDFSSAVSPVAGLPGATDVVANATPLIRIKWDMRVDDQVDFLDNSLNWGLEVFGATPGDPELPPPLLVNVVRSVDFLGPLIVGSDPNEPGFAAILSESAPATGVWATYQVDLNYTDHTYQFYLNGVAMGGVHDFLEIDNGLDVGLTVALRGIDAGHFDNFSVSTIPEPAGLGLMLLGALLLKSRAQA